MTDTTQKPNSQNPKVYKEGGLIRWSAVIPFFIIVVLCAVYFKLFFDSHMKSALEWGGYKALGTEVNIANFESSFVKGNVAISGLQITSAEQPDFNSIELGSIRFDVNWDALLRLKFVVEEMAVENVQFMSKRKYRGKVAPPPPPSNEPSLVSQVKDKAIGKVDEKGQGNLLGDLSAFLQTGDYKAQLANIESQLKSKQMANDLKAKWETKQKDWDAKIKTLPTDADFKAYKTKFEAIKVKDFKTPQELDASVKQFNTLKAEVEGKLKLVNDTKDEFNADLTQIKKDYASLDEQIKADVASIKDHMKIPKLDSKQIAKSIFMDYLNPYIAKLDKINKLAEKYLPPKYSKMVNENLDSKKLLAGGKKKTEVKPEDDDTIQPHPRAEGVTYEFPVKNGYPLFWIQQVKVSSKSNEQADYGDISGVISNIVSNQRQIGKQTEMHLSGDFKSHNIHGMKVDAFLNNLKEEPAAGMDFAVASYPLKAISLMKNNDGTIAMPSASINIAAKAATEGFKSYNIGLVNTFNNVQFELSAKEKVVEEILKNTFAQLTTFDLTAEAKGSLSSLDVDVTSSLGDKLQDALSASVKQKIEDLNKEIKVKIDNEIGKVKSEIEKQISTLTKGYVGNANEAQAKLDAQKNVADQKIAQAKKDLENKAKKELEQKGKKAVDDLKKKFGF
ncbi:MAG: TIGR03545 family protein [Pseudobdellovibrio sp.]|nr:TIGR03545 family protein [Pseudobdellovibrio sp.]